jgi:hypothetical protein
MPDKCPDPGKPVTRPFAIPGVTDEDLERIHFRHFGGRGSGGFRHLPSGITVIREFPPTEPVRRTYEEALAELERVLREQGWISSQ